MARVSKKEGAGGTKSTRQARMDAANAGAPSTGTHASKQVLPSLKNLIIGALRKSSPLPIRDIERLIQEQYNKSGVKRSSIRSTVGRMVKMGLVQVLDEKAEPWTYRITEGVDLSEYDNVEVLDRNYPDGMSLDAYASKSVPDEHKLDLAQISLRHLIQRTNYLTDRAGDLLDEQLTLKDSAGKGYVVLDELAAMRKNFCELATTLSKLVRAEVEVNPGIAIKGVMFYMPGVNAPAIDDQGRVILTAGEDADKRRERYKELLVEPD